MQDRICRSDESLLQRTAGPYIRVNLDVSSVRQALLLCPKLRTYCGVAANGRNGPIPHVAPRLKPLVAHLIGPGRRVEKGLRKLSAPK
jgi:hypothetical protein